MLPIYSLPPYTDIFGDPNTFNIAAALDTIPSLSVLEFIAHLCAQIHIHETDPKTQNWVLKMWKDLLPDDVLNKYVKSILKHKSIMITDNVTIYYFEQYILKHNNKRHVPLTPSDYLVIFQIYMWCSWKWTNDQNIILENKYKDKNKIEICVQIPYIGVWQSRDFRPEVTKAIYFFEYCLTNGLKDLIEPTLNKYGYDVNDWKSFIQDLLTLYIQPEKMPGVRASLLIIDERYPLAIALVEKYCNPKINDTAEDFMILRNNPLYKMGEHKYLVLSYDFLIDKIYKVYLFDICRTLKNANFNYLGRNYCFTKKDFEKAKSFFSTIIEHSVFYKSISECLTKKIDCKADGLTLDTTIGGRMPDYYIRSGNKVYIIEFKDELFPSTSKLSYDYDKILNTLNEKLVRNKKNDDKGSRQLANFVSDYREGKYEAIDRYDCTKTNVYPILVYTDVAFQTRGFNRILNDNYQKALEENLEKAGTSYYSNPITMISLDKLILYSFLFKNRYIPFHHVVNEHIKYRKQKDANIAFEDILMNNVIKLSKKQVASFVQQCLITMYKKKLNLEQKV